jgi:hypothetical protein
MAIGQTAPENFFYELLRLRFNVYYDFFKIKLKNDPCRYVIYFYASILRKEQQVSNTIMYKHSFSQEETRNLLELSEKYYNHTEGAASAIFDILNYRIEQALSAVELNHEKLKGYSFDRDYSKIMLQYLID